MPRARVGEFLLVLASVLSIMVLVSDQPWWWSLPAVLLMGGIAGYLLFYDLIQAYKRALRRGETVTEPRRVRRAARVLKIALASALAAGVLVVVFPVVSAIILPSAIDYYPALLMTAAIIVILALLATVPAWIIVTGDFLAFLRRQGSLRPPRE